MAAAMRAHCRLTTAPGALSSPPGGIEWPVIGHPAVPLPGPWSLAGYTTSPAAPAHMDVSPPPPWPLGRELGARLGLLFQEGGCPPDILLLGVAPCTSLLLPALTWRSAPYPHPTTVCLSVAPRGPQPCHPDVCTQHLSPPCGPNSPLLLQSRAQVGGTEPQGLPSRAPRLFCNVQLTAVQPDVDLSTKDTSMFLCASLGSPQRPLPQEIGAAQGSPGSAEETVGGLCCAPCHPPGQHRAVGHAGWGAGWRRGGGGVGRLKVCAQWRGRDPVPAGLSSMTPRAPGTALQGCGGSRGPEDSGVQIPELPGALFLPLSGLAQDYPEGGVIGRCSGLLDAPRAGPGPHPCSQPGRPCSLGAPLMHLHRPLCGRGEIPFLTIVGLYRRGTRLDAISLGGGGTVSR